MICKTFQIILPKRRTKCKRGNEWTIMKAGRVYKNKSIFLIRVFNVAVRKKLHFLIFAGGVVRTASIGAYY